MAHTLFRSLLFTLPPAAGYFVLGPIAAVSVDFHFGLAWPLPRWLSALAVLFIPSGAAVAIWGWWLFATLGRGTPNPLSPPRRLVAIGPFRFTRNPIMLGGWLASFGLALALRSPCYLAVSFVVVIVGSVYVRVLEEPSLRRRFGAEYEAYARSVARWVPGTHRCPFHGKS